jgi:hypothetical protein
MHVRCVGRSNTSRIGLAIEHAEDKHDVHHIISMPVNHYPKWRDSFLDVGYACWMTMGLPPDYSDTRIESVAKLWYLGSGRRGGHLMSAGKQNCRRSYTANNIDSHRPQNTPVSTTFRTVLWDIDPGSQNAQGLQQTHQVIACIIDRSMIANCRRFRNFCIVLFTNANPLLQLAARRCAESATIHTDHVRFA